MSRPWMPLNVADYLADTSHLSTVEHGAYMLLIMHYWQTRSLPIANAKLAHICRMTENEWNEVRETLAAFFDEGWKHKRIEREIKKADELLAVRSAAGKAGADARYSKWNSKRIANAEQTDSLSPTPTPLKKDNNTGKSKNGVYAFVQGVVRLTAVDLEKWERAFPHISVTAELMAAEPWLSTQPNWYQAAAGLLAKREREATRAPPRERRRERDPLGNWMEVGDG